MTDITFDLSGFVVNLRVGALVQSEGSVLICRMPSEDWWYVPGGRIAVGESSIDAISRELNEELEGEWIIGSPVASSENFFTLDSRRFQEICFYYAVEWLSDPKALTTLSHEEFKWVAKGELGNYTIKPDFIQSLLTAGHETMQHIIHQDAEQGAQLDAFGAADL